MCCRNYSVLLMSCHDFTVWYFIYTFFFIISVGGMPGLFFQPYRKPKRIRTAFSPSQLLQLEKSFEKSHYVVGQERKDLANELQLTETQVSKWIIIGLLAPEEIVRFYLYLFFQFHKFNEIRNLRLRLKQKNACIIFLTEYLVFFSIFALLVKK